MKKWYRIVALSTLSLQPGDSMAQELIANSLHELLHDGRLAIGDAIYVTRSIGRRRLSGDLEDLTSSALTLTDKRITWTLTEEQILRVERGDSTANGVWTGLLLGVIPICAYSRSSEQASYAMLYYGGPLLAAAGLIGGLVDWNVRDTVYDAHGGKRARWSPVSPKGGLGASLSYGW